jgi:hypothetical protein
MQTRFFNEANFDKLDKLIKYLGSNNIEYTAHWIGLTEKQIELRRKKFTDQGKSFDAAKLPLMEICWFG